MDHFSIKIASCDSVLASTWPLIDCSSNIALYAFHLRKARYQYQVYIASGRLLSDQKALYDMV